MSINNTFNSLPRDVRYLTYLKLDGESIIRCKRVCKWFHEDISSFPFWKVVFARENPGFTPLQAPSLGWEAFYKQQTLIERHLYTESHVETIPLAYDRGFILGKKVYINSYLVISNSGVNEIARSCFNLETKELTKIDIFPNQTSLGDDFKPIDERYFYILTQTQTNLYIWDSIEDKCIFAKDNVMDGIFHIKGTHVIFPTTEGFLEVWDYKTNTLIKQYEGTQCLEITSFNPKLGDYSGINLIIGNIFFVLMRRKVVLAYDLENGQQKYTISFIDGAETVRSIIAGENRLVVITSRMKGFFQKFEAVIYDSETGVEVKKISIVTKKATVAGNKLIALHNWDSFGYWNLETGEMRQGFSCNQGFRRWSTNPNGDRLFILTPSNVCILIDLKEGKKLCEIQIPFTGNQQFHFWRVDNHFLIRDNSSNKNPILFWDIEKLNSIHLGNKNRVINFDGSRIFVKEYPNYKIYDLTKTGESIQKVFKSFSESE